MRVFVTGDCHQKYEKIFNFIKRFELTEDDIIIVCGDMGLFWDADQKDAQYWIEEYEKRCNGVHLFWIDGNHENFDIIDSWKCEKIMYDNSTHIHYIPRGCTTWLNGKRCLFMGGADSIDRFWRKDFIEWWPQEQITQKQIDDVSIEYYDYIFTHCGPYTEVFKNRGFLYTLGNVNENNAIHTSEKMLDQIAHNIDFGHWYFGHYHQDIKLDKKYTCVFNDFIEIS